MKKHPEYFQFKQFRIYHDQCALKVGTDGVLLGAWSKLPEKKIRETRYQSLILDAERD